MTVEVVRCRGEVGMMATPHEFVFRIYKDGSVDADVSPVASLDPAQVAATGEKATEYKVMNGCVVNVSSKTGSSGEPPAKTYKVSFTIVRFDRQIPQAQMSLVVTFRLSTTDGLGGCHSEARHTSFQKKRMGMHLYPLTPGSYELRGFVTFACGSVNDGCVLELVLHRDGSLRGEFRDSLLSLFSPISGKWTKDRVWFTLQVLRPNNVARTYAFDFKCVFSSLRGVCIRDRSAFASFELHPTRIKRCAWSPLVHRYFTRSFRAASKLLLLSSLPSTQSAFGLPSAMWIEILSFCSADWFGDEDGGAIAGQIEPSFGALLTSIIKVGKIPVGAALAMFITCLALVYCLQYMDRFAKYI